MAELALLLESVWTGVAAHLWQSALFLAVLALLAAALRRAPARVLSSLYWIGVAKLVLPLPWLGTLSTRWIGASSKRAAGDGAAWEAISVWMYPTIDVEPGAASTASLLWPALTAVWLVGFSLCVLRRRARRPWIVETSVRPAKLSAAIAAGGLAERDVVVDSAGLSPYVVGVRRPVIAFPERLVTTLEPDELTAILVHEREHLRRRDPLRYELLSLLRAALWFYPPVWWLVRRIRQATEMACDEAVLREGLRAADYCRALARVVTVGLAQRATFPAPGILGLRGSFLHRRLARIRSQRRFEVMPTHRLTLAAAAIAALTLSLSPIVPTAPAIAETAAVDDASDLERLAAADRRLALRIDDRKVADVLQELVREAGLHLEVHGTLPDRTLTLTGEPRRLADLLEEVGTRGGLRYRVPAPDRLEVRPVMLAGVDGVSSPRFIEDSRVTPVYPKELAEAREGGRVVLQVLVDERGHPVELQVLRGFHAAADQAAVDAVRQWRWEPATSADEPVAVYFTVVLEFSIGDDSM